LALGIALFFSLLFTGLTMSAAGAHLLELLSKLALSRDDYIIVQQIYRGWALLGVVIVAALLATLAAVILGRRQRQVLILALVALSSLAGAQAVFWLLTYPVNQETRNWTAVPADWLGLRLQWEFSHVAGAVLDLAAFIAPILGGACSTPLAVQAILALFRL
jgi:hypothetical protein